MLEEEQQMRLFDGLNVDEMLKIHGKRSCGVSIAVAQNDHVEVYCSGSGRFGRNFPVHPDMLFQAGSVSKSMFSLTLMRYVDKGLIDLDADISDVLADVLDAHDAPLTFAALLSHTAGFNVGGFGGYRARHSLLTLEDVVMGRGNNPRVKQIKPYGMQHSYSGGGITLAELAFTRLTGTTLRDAFEKEVAIPLALTKSGFFQPLDEERVANAAFGGMLGLWEDPRHGYHYYPEHAAAGFWTTPSELVKIGMALSRSIRENGLLCQKTARRMVTPVMGNAGLGIFLGNDDMPDWAGHSGWNRGFLTEWGFSLTEDICVAVMVNRSNPALIKTLYKISRELFRRAKESLQQRAEHA